MLVGEKKNDVPPVFSATDFHDYIDDKISSIRPASSSAIAAAFKDHRGSELLQFKEVTLEEVTSIIRSSPSKQCSFNPLPTWLLKDCVVVLASFITKTMNISLSLGCFPSTWKYTIVSPLLKKVGLDESFPVNYRPVSNVPCLSKVLERIVHRQTTTYLLQHQLFPDFQSAYRRCHSTETAVLKVFSDIIDGIEKGNIALLCLLALTAAFDTVDHGIIKQRLTRSFGIKGRALMWVDSYLTDRSQSVHLAGVTTNPRKILCEVPQGSVLGPLLFTLYTADIGLIIKAHELLHHCYADDTQLYLCGRPVECAGMKSRVLQCIDSIPGWMSSNRLKLNSSKSEFLWCATARCLHLVDKSVFRLEDRDVTPSTFVRNLGAFF